MKKEFFGTKAKICLLFVAVFLMSQCANKAAISGALPTDIRGIRLDMSKDDASKRMVEIAVLKETAPKGQEVWTLNDDPNFNNMIIGYDKENTVKSVTATLDKGSVASKERMKFSDIGDISIAKKESVAHINKYTWDVATGNNMPEHQVYTYGEEEDNLIHFSLVKRMEKEEEGEE